MKILELFEGKKPKVEREFPDFDTWCLKNDIASEDELYDIIDSSYNYDTMTGYILDEFKKKPTAAQLKKHIRDAAEWCVQDRKSPEAKKVAAAAKKYADEHAAFILARWDLLTEEIKGWKHAGRDIAKARHARAEDAMEIKLVRVKKSGDESKMHDAVKKFKTEKEAREHHDLMVKNNPGHSIKHNLYVGDKVQVLEHWNPLEDERREGRAMDREKRDFKRRELDFELRHETEGNRTFTPVKYGIEIDGRLWKKEGKAVEFRSKATAEKSASTIAARGKKTHVVPLG